MIVFPYSIIFLLIGLPQLSIGVICIVFGIIVSLILNMKFRHYLSKWVFFINVLLGAYYYSAIFNGVANVQLIYFVLVIAGVNVFQSKVDQTLSVMLSIFLYYLLELTNYRFFSCNIKSLSRIDD